MTSSLVGQALGQLIVSRSDWSDKSKGLDPLILRGLLHGPISDLFFATVIVNE